MTEPKKVSDEFIKNVKQYLDIDDKLIEYKEKSKLLNQEKKEREEYILSYLQTLDEKVIDIPNGKLRRNVCKSQSPLKKENIQKALTELVGDAIKASTMTDQIIKSRQTVEKVMLKRTKTKTKVQE
jgi:hypothetical protein